MPILVSRFLVSRARELQGTFLNARSGNGPVACAGEGAKIRVHPCARPAGKALAAAGCCRAVVASLGDRRRRPPARLPRPLLAPLRVDSEPSPRTGDGTVTHPTALAVAPGAKKMRSVTADTRRNVGSPSASELLHTAGALPTRTNTLDRMRQLEPDSPQRERRAALADVGRWLGTLPPRLVLEVEDAIRAASERAGYDPKAVERAFHAKFRGPGQTDESLSRRPSDARTRPLHRRVNDQGILTYAEQAAVGSSTGESVSRSTSTNTPRCCG